MTDTARAFLTTLQAATNSHDLDALVACFTEDYSNQTPVHPARAFTGRDQVRSNWQQIFGSVPDISATVLKWVSSDAAVWSEWQLAGTRHDGTQHLMRGVIIFGLDGDRACSARFYLELVDEESSDVGAALRAQVHADVPS